MSEIFFRLLKKRGITEEFLNPKYEELVDPFLLPDMEKAVQRIVQARDKGEKVLIFGDYDADGVTASTVMFDTLRLAGIKEIEILLPDRFADGYGMSRKAIEKAKEMGAGLVVTVDCGSANEEIIRELRENGVDTVVTDHHECPEKLPEAVAVVNPKRKSPLEEDKEKIRELAGVGVAFMVARAFALRGIIPSGQEKWLLDLVAIGTVCDSMILLGENRRLVFYGMKVIEKTRRPGLKELIRLLKAREINTDVIGFQIGPRLNAAGRIKTAEDALKLLMTTSRTEAARLARELDRYNYMRKEQQTAAVQEIEKAINPRDRVIVVAGDWPEGILGIIAGRISEEHKKPAFALTYISREEVFKGSGRSFGEFNLKNALDECQKLIVSGGGHAGACGVKVPKDGIEDFRAGMNNYYDELHLKNQERFLERDVDVETEDVGEFDEGLIQEIKRLEPFGDGNLEPTFLLRDVFVLNVKKMGGKGEHLNLFVRGEDGETMKLMGFFAPEEWMEIEKGMRADILITVVLNEWNGLKNVEGRILRLEFRED